MNYNDIKTNTLDLLQYIENENYLGYDPYDFYLSPIAKYLPKSILFLHLQKVSPINMRPILGIKKGMVTKVYALLIDSYLNLYQLENNKAYVYKALLIYKNMMNATIVNSETEIGWGRNYPFKTGGEIHDNKKPLVYLNSRLGQSMINLYDITKDTSILVDLKKVIRNLLKTGRVLKRDGYTFIGYSPDKNTRLTFNVSMVAVELMMKYLDRAGDWECVIDGNNIEEICYDIIRTMIHYQEPDGAWTYGYSAKGQLFSQKDFHQGFVADSLHNVLNLIKDPKLKEEATKAYKKGYEYLKNNQINDKGEFYWRFPKKYPLDIHNHAQGIISLSINENDNNNQKLNILIDQVFNSFWNKRKKRFYYQKWQFFTNKISYMRWCNSWMLFALTTYLRHSKENN